MVRSFLNGRFENTAFCVLAPNGEKRLSGTGRSPNQGLSTSRGPGRQTDDSTVIERMNEIADDFRQRGDEKEAVVQDFNSFRQALNVASGDQRLLVFVAAGKSQIPAAELTLRPVMTDAAIIGRFHVDLADAKTDADWAKVIKKESARNGFVIIQADDFGMAGTVLEQLPITASADQVKAALLRANLKFAESEQRKVYSEHVSIGRREGIFFENGMPYGEDRDGDGEIDHRGGPKGKGKGKGKKGPK